MSAPARAAPADLERHDADAEVGGDDAQRRVEAGDDDAIGDGALGARGGALQHRVHRRRRRQADVVEGERLLEADRGASGERVAGVDGEREPVAPVRTVREALEVDVVPADAERRVAVAHLAHEVARHALLDVDLDVLVVGLAHERRDVVEQRLGDRRGGCDQAHMALHAAGEGGGIGDDAVHREEDAARVLEKRQPGRRRLHAAPPAHQQLDAEVVLELGDALADRRRLDVLLLGGARHRAAVGDRDEQAKRLEVDVAHAVDDRR